MLFSSSLHLKVSKTHVLNKLDTDSLFLVPLQVSHKAVLSVDEAGTEAAAATTIEIMPMSLPDTMTINRPFLMFILEHSTRSILFMGKITNPTAE